MSFVQPLDGVTLDLALLRLAEARVRSLDAGMAELELDGETVLARLAMAGGIRPAVGDVAVVISQQDRHYVVGVVSSGAKTVIEVAGDLDLSAPHGSVTLSAGGGVRVAAPTIVLAAHSLRLVAHAVVEEFGRLWCWVREQLDLKAGAMRTDIDQTYRLRAQQILERAEGRVSIDGERIDLG